MNKPSDFILEINNVSKLYKLGDPANRHLTLRKNLTDLVVRLVDRLKKKPAAVIESSPEVDSRFFALKDVTFSIARGEVVGIVGRNGAGKSTLLKIISNITAPSQGEVTIQGKICSLLEVGTGFHPELTGHENIFLTGAILGFSRKELELKYDEIVGFSGLVKFLNTPIKHYSSGMELRLAFSVAAFVEPEILIVDEVLAVGDAEFQEKCLSKLRDHSSAGRTILVTSHNLQAIEGFCTRALWLDQGVLMEDGDVDHVINRYRQATSNISEALELSEHESIFDPEPDPVLPWVLTEEDLLSPTGQGTYLGCFTPDRSVIDSIEIGKSWKIRLEFDLHEHTENVVATTTLVHNNVIQVATYSSLYCTLDSGRYFVEFDVELYLKPGTLSLSTTLRSHGIDFYRHLHRDHIIITEGSVEHPDFNIESDDLLALYPTSTIFGNSFHSDS